MPRTIYVDGYVLVEQREDGTYLVDTPLRRVSCRTAEEALEILALELGELWGEKDAAETTTTSVWDDDFISEWEAGWRR